MKCQVSKCNKRKGECRFTGGYCNAHYLRLRRGKNINFPSHKEKRGYVDGGDYIKIPLGIGAKQGFAIADKDMLWLGDYNWSKTKHGYARGVVRGAIILMHHAVIGNPTKRGLVTDHFNRDTLDNRRANLNIVPQSINAYNKLYPGDKSSQYRGVSKVRLCTTWRATIKGKHIGSFKTEIEAAVAYNIRAKELYGKYAILNKVAQ